jgi:tetratricopeptide (TPR) repeat protein
MAGHLAALVFWAVLAQGQVTVAASDDLAAARSLYASGDYETALTHLDAARADATADEVDQYRALCLLALGRTRETERALESLIIRRPLFRLTDTDVSPRLVSMFHAVRQRLLPGIVKDLYAAGKGSFEAKRYAEAASQLGDMLDLLDDEDAIELPDAVSDLRILGEGFLKLADAEVARSKAAALAAAASPTGVATEVTSAGRVESVVSAPYTDGDPGVTPPVAMTRDVPPWRPPNAVIGARAYQGHLRIVIDATGQVESAALVRPFLPGYDDLLVQAARGWRFRPATKDGVPVRYAKIFTIDVAPR